MKKMYKRHDLANKMLGKSVVNVSSTFIEDVNNTLDDESPLIFGVKNTNQISVDIIKKLVKDKKYIFHTVDAMSDRGRAIDISLINPLTARIMTGSSSGSCINVVYGINDFALGTDGGGSVLAPAISTQLYSFLGKGMGLIGQYEKISTDGLNFTPGIGVISHNYDYIVRVIKDLCPYDQKPITNSKKLRIAIPKANSITLPMGKDMTDMIYKSVGDNLDNYLIEEVEVPDLSDRYQAIPFMNKCFSQGFDMIMTLEGPIDVLGYGDTVINEWGDVGKSIQRKSGKYLIKSANMINASALTIPIEELAMGIVIITDEGVGKGFELMKLGQILAEKNKGSVLYDKYFINKCNANIGEFEWEG